MKKAITYVTIGTMLVSMLGFASTSDAASKRDITPPSTPKFTTKGNINKGVASQYKLVGKGEPYSTILVVATDGKAKVAKYGVVDKYGNFSIILNTTPLRDGSIKVTSTLSDNSKNVSKLVAFNVYKDTVGPATPKGNAATVITKTNLLYRITGTGTANSTTIVTLLDKSNKGINQTVKTDKYGKFDLTFDASRLADGIYRLVIKQVDAYGNYSYNYQKSIVKDTKATEPKIKYNENINADNPTFDVSGIAETGAQINIEIKNTSGKGVMKTQNADAKGNFSVSLPTSTLSDGNYVMSLYQKDIYGNISNKIQDEIYKDTVAPKEPTIHGMVDISSTNVSKYTISGVAEAGHAVAVAIGDVNDKVVYGIGYTNQDGSFSITLDTTPLHDGVIKIGIAVGDEAENVSPVVEKEIRKNTSLN